MESLKWPEAVIDGNVFNAGYDNQTLLEIAGIVQQGVGQDVEIATVPTDDHRSYHVSSDKIRRELGYEPKRSIGDAVEDLVMAFKGGKIPDPLTDISYYNIKTMQAIQLK